MSALTGTGGLVRLVLRRDRLLLAVLILLAVGIPLANAGFLAALLPTIEARQNFTAASMANPVISVTLGPIQNPTIEGIVAWRSNVQGVVVAGLAGLLVIRHTRAEEEAGRRELLGSAPVGRQAGLAAALVAVAATHVLIMLVLAAVLILGVGYPAAGSVAFALSLAAAGWFFAAVAGTAAQVARSASQARSICVGILAAAFVPSVLSEGDENSWLFWLSPVGWGRLVRPYAGEQWWVFLIFLAVVGGLTGAALALSARRDLDTGLLPGRSNSRRRAQASSLLSTPLALAWRLHRDGLFGWGVALAAFSALLGWAATTFEQLFSGLSAIQQWLSAMGGRTIGESFLAVLTFDLRLVVACVAIVTALRLHSEESSGRLSPLLAGPTSRSRWMTSHVVVAFVGPSAILLAIGLTAGLTYGLTTGRPDELWGQLGTAALSLPAAWFMASITIALFGLLPRGAVAASWGVMVTFVLFVLLWEVGAIGQTTFLFTPFAYCDASLQVAAHHAGV